MVYIDMGNIIPTFYYISYFILFCQTEPID